MAKAMGESEAAGFLEQNLKQEQETLQKVNTIAKRLAQEAAKQVKASA